GTKNRGQRASIPGARRYAERRNHKLRCRPAWRAAHAISATARPTMIQTTVVGSYPVPGWLRICSTREGLRDAMLAVLKTQELAGIDVVADGELYRWDVNHPETNGMIDYFVRPLQGVQVELTLDQLRAWRQKTG